MTTGKSGEAYVLVPDGHSPRPQISYPDTKEQFTAVVPWTQISYDDIKEQVTAAVSSLADTVQTLGPRRRFRLLLSGAILFFFVTLRIFSSPKPDGSLDDVHIKHLASPLAGYKVVKNINETTVIVGQHHPVHGHFPHDYQWIDPETRAPFREVMNENGMNNNAMARMPAGSPYDALVVARGRNGLYMDPTEQIEYVNLTIVGFFVNYNPSIRAWERAGPEPYILHLPVWRQFPRPCEHLVNGGQADPRIVWSDAGEPLAIIGTVSRVVGVCKAVGIVDLRAIWPFFREHLDEIGYGDIPIKFDSFTEIGKEDDRARYEKNWAPFFPGPAPATRGFSWLFGSRHGNLAQSTWPYFASKVFPRSILKVDPSLDTSDRSPDSYVLAAKIDLSIINKTTVSLANSDCVTDSLPKKWGPKGLHQATPYYRVTMCPRGTCIPTRENTVLLGLIHYKRSLTSYRRMFVTMSTDAPFKILSVSPLLHFGSVAADKHVVFSVSMAFFPTKNATELKELEEWESPWKKSGDTPGGYLNHGWLDDTLVIGSGLRDEAYDCVHLPVATALRGHTLCP